MNRFFTSVLACLCVLAAMAVMPQDKTKYLNGNLLKSVNLTKPTKATNISTPFRVAKASATDGYKKLGTGTYTDNFFGVSKSVEIWQSTEYTNYFHIIEPYTGGSDYMELIVMPQGATLNEVTITKSNLVLFWDTNTGIYNNNYNDYIWACHPFEFTNYDSNESYWTYNKVLSYQNNNLPKEVQLAPYYWIEEVGGWDHSQENGVVKITFPSGAASYPDPYHSSVTCMNSNPSSLSTSDMLQLKAVYGNNGTAGNVKTVPVIFSADGNLTLVKAGDQRSDYFSTSQTTVSYSMSLTDVSPGSYYATTMFYDENEAGWFYNSKYLVDIKIVPDIILVQSITLSQTSATLTSGNTLQLSATPLPTNATNKTVSWSSSNTSVATVSSSGLVTAKNVSTSTTVTITCSATDGSGVKATCSVTVKPSVIPVERITLNQTSATLSTESPNNTLQLTATVLPTNATNKTVSWTTSSSSVATVSSSGLVTAIATGTATITCSATDGSGVKATCSIKVETTPDYPDVYIQSVTCKNSDPDNISLNEKVKLSATYWNDGAAGTVYTWPILCTVKGSNNDNIDKLIVDGDLSVKYFNASTNTTVDYELGIDTIQPGTYYATVLFYDMAEESWYYNGSEMVKVTIVPPGPDFNGDGYVNGTDLVALTNIILGRSDKRPAADVNGDGQVNGTDYVALVNIILGRSSNARSLDVNPSDASFASASFLSVDDFSINPGEEGELVVNLTNTSEEITLVQFDLDLPSGLSLKKEDGEYAIDITERTTYKKHSLDASETDGIIRFLLSSTKNTPLIGSEGGIVKMTLVADASYDARTAEGIGIRNILLVTPDEKETKPEDFFIIPTGIDKVMAETTTNAPVYSLSGQRLATPQKGLNIVGGKKLLVK